MAAAQAPCRLRTAADEGVAISRGRFTAVAEARCLEEALADEAGSQPDAAQAGMGALQAAARQALPESDKAVQNGCAPLLAAPEQIKLLEEELRKQEWSFAQTWETIQATLTAEEHYNALLDGSSSRLPAVTNSDLIERHLAQPQPQPAGLAGQATSDRPNTPTSTANSTSSCTSRTPPATNGSDHRSGARSRGSASTEPRTASTPVTAGSGIHDNADNARESTLRMWSSLGDTLQEVVQRNLKLEEENRCLREEMEKVDQQICDANQELAALDPNLQVGGASSSGAAAHPAIAAGVALPYSGPAMSTVDPYAGQRVFDMEHGGALDASLLEGFQQLAPPVQVQAAAASSASGPSTVGVVEQPATRGRFTISTATSSTATVGAEEPKEPPRRLSEDGQKEPPRRLLEDDALETVRRCTDPQSQAAPVSTAAATAESDSNVEALAGTPAPEGQLADEAAQSMISPADLAS